MAKLDIIDCMKGIYFKVLVILLCTVSATAQSHGDMKSGADTVGINVSTVSDSISAVLQELPCEKHEWQSAKASPYRFKPLQLVVPVTLFSVGLVG